MRRSASEVIRTLENRIARLENKTASSMTAQAYDETQGWGERKPIKCELNARSIASCIKKEFGCDIDQNSITLFAGNSQNPTMISMECHTSYPVDITHVYIELKSGSEYPLF